MTVLGWLKRAFARVGEHESRLFGSTGEFDTATRAFCDRFGLGVRLLVGDLRTIEIETGEVDLVFIDGDDSYEAVRNDFARFGTHARRRLRPLRRCVPEEHFPTHSETVVRLVGEIGRPDQAGKL